MLVQSDFKSNRIIIHLKVLQEREALKNSIFRIGRTGGDQSSQFNLLSPFPSCLGLGIAVLLPAQVLLPGGDEDEDEGDCDDNGGDDENNGDH